MLENPWSAVGNPTLCSLPFGLELRPFRPRAYRDPPPLAELFNHWCPVDWRSNPPEGSLITSEVETIGTRVKSPKLLVPDLYMCRILNTLLVNSASATDKTGNARQLHKTSFHDFRSILFELTDWVGGLAFYPTQKRSF